LVQGAAPEGNECNGHSGLRRGVDVRFEGRNAPLERFISDLRNVPGIYALVVGGNALDCQRTKRNETSGLGERPLHHLDAAYGDHAARNASPTITLGFTRLSFAARRRSAGCLGIPGVSDKRSAHSRRRASFPSYAGAPGFGDAQLSVAVISVAVILAVPHG